MNTAKTNKKQGERVPYELIEQLDAMGNVSPESQWLVLLVVSLDFAFRLGLASFVFVGFGFVVAWFI